MGDLLDAVLLAKHCAAMAAQLPGRQLLSFESAAELCRSCVRPTASVSSALALLRSGGQVFNSLMCASLGLAFYLDVRQQMPMLGVATNRWTWSLLGAGSVMAPAFTALFVNTGCLLVALRVIWLMVNAVLSRQEVIARQQRDHGRQLPGEPLVTSFREAVARLARMLFRIAILANLLLPTVRQRIMVAARSLAHLHIL